MMSDNQNECTKLKEKNRMSRALSSIDIKFKIDE